MIATRNMLGKIRLSQFDQATNNRWRWNFHIFIGFFNFIFLFSKKRICIMSEKWERKIESTAYIFAVQLLIYKIGDGWHVSGALKFH